MTVRQPPEGHDVAHKHGDQLHVWDGRLGECVAYNPASHGNRPLSEEETRERLSRWTQQVTEALERIGHYLANLESLRQTQPPAGATPWPDDFSIDTCMNYADDEDHANAELNESDLRLVVSALQQKRES